MKINNNLIDNDFEVCYPVAERGETYLDKRTHSPYIVTENGDYYGLINLATGEPYSGFAECMDDIFDGDRGDFERVECECNLLRRV